MLVLSHVARRLSSFVCKKHVSLNADWKYRNAKILGNNLNRLDTSKRYSIYVSKDRFHTITRIRQQKFEIEIYFCCEMGLMVIPLCLQCKLLWPLNCLFRNYLFRIIGLFCLQRKVCRRHENRNSLTNNIGVLLIVCLYSHNNS